MVEQVTRSEMTLKYGLNPHAIIGRYELFTNLFRSAITRLLDFLLRYNRSEMESTSLFATTTRDASFSYRERLN